MRIDYRKSSEDILLDLINHYNSEYMTALGIDGIHGNDVIIGLPFAVNAIETRISITPKVTAPYIDAFSFSYRRVPLINLLKTNLDTTFKITDQGLYRVSDFIGEINERWGINLGPSDYVDDSIILGGDDVDVILVVRANQNSLVWVGEIAITLTMGVALSSVITITELDGFVMQDYELSNTINKRNLLGFVPIK